MHLETAARQIAGEAARQSTEGLVPEPRRGHCRRRFPCDVSPRDMRQHPIGTGPFKFVEFKPNEYVKVARNSDYWRNGRPYLDGIEYTVIPNRSTAMLSFIAGKFDMTFPFEGTVPLPRDVKAQAPEAICELVPANASANLIITVMRHPSTIQ